MWVNFNFFSWVLHISEILVNIYCDIDEESDHNPGKERVFLPVISEIMLHFHHLNTDSSSSLF